MVTCTCMYILLSVLFYVRTLIAAFTWQWLECHIIWVSALSRWWLHKNNEMVYICYSAPFCQMHATLVTIHISFGNPVQSWDFSTFWGVSNHWTQNYLQGHSILQLPSLPIAEYPFTPGLSWSVGLMRVHAIPSHCPMRHGIIPSVICSTCHIARTTRHIEPDTTIFVQSVCHVHQMGVSHSWVVSGKGWRIELNQS